MMSLSLFLLTCIIPHPLSVRGLIVTGGDGPVNRHVGPWLLLCRKPDHQLNPMKNNLFPLRLVTYAYSRTWCVFQTDKHIHVFKVTRDISWPRYFKTNTIHDTFLPRTSNCSSETYFSEWQLSGARGCKCHLMAFLFQAVKLKKTVNF